MVEPNRAISTHGVMHRVPTIDDVRSDLSNDALDWLAQHDQPNCIQAISVQGSLGWRLSAMGLASDVQRDLSRDQMLLRDIATQQLEEAVDTCSWRDQESPHGGTYRVGPERPHWARGAILLLTPEHYQALRAAAHCDGK